MATKPPVKTLRRKARDLPAIDMRAAWRTFDLGDTNSTSELKRMLKEGRAAEQFLSDRGEQGGVLFKLRLNLNCIADRIAARRAA